MRPQFRLRSGRSFGPAAIVLDMRSHSRDSSRRRGLRATNTSRSSAPIGFGLRATVPDNDKRPTSRQLPAPRRASVVSNTGKCEARMNKRFILGCQNAVEAGGRRWGASHCAVGRLHLISGAVFQFVRPRLLAVQHSPSFDQEHWPTGDETRGALADNPLAVSTEPLGNVIHRRRQT